MTPADKKKIWNALFNRTRNGYPGATYQAYDTPKDPRVRGGRWYWTRAQLYDLYQQLVKWGDLGQTIAAWRELQKYKTKITPSALRQIYQSISTASYSITPSSLSVTEGQTITFNVVTSGVPDGTILYWTLLSSCLNPIVAADFTDDAGSGSFVVNSNLGIVSRTLKDDFIAEAPECFNIEIRTGSVAGPIQLTSPEIQVFNNPEPLRLVYNDLNSLPFDYTDVNEWNIFFDLPNQGTPFTSVEVIGTTEVRLRGSAAYSISLLPFLFQYDGNLTGIYDYGGFISVVGQQTFFGCSALSEIYLPAVTDLYFDAIANLSNPVVLRLPSWNNSAITPEMSYVGYTLLDISSYANDFSPSLVVVAPAASTVDVYLNNAILNGNSGQPFYASVVGALGYAPTSTQEINIYTPTTFYKVGIADYYGLIPSNNKIGVGTFTNSTHIFPLRTGMPIPVDVNNEFHVQINPLTGSFTPANFGGSYLFSDIRPGSITDFSITLDGTGLVGGETFNVLYKTAAGAVLATSPTYTFIALPGVVNGTSGPTTTTSVTISNNQVTSAGGGIVNDRGISYGISPGPYTQVPSGSGLGSYNVTLNTLSANTKYQWGAYATNEGGTNQISEALATFTTLPNPTTGTVGSITTTGAVVTGSTGGTGTISLPQKGVCYSSVNNPPTTADTKVIQGSGLGTFNSTLTGLTPSTTYYLRAYAINAGGTNYGVTRTFTTSAPTPQTAGPNNPGNAGDQTYGDESWINPTNVLVADNVYATVPAIITPSWSNYLQTYNHGFSIPVAAVITGIEVQVKGKYTGTSSPVLAEINLWTGGLYPFGFNVGQKFPNTTFTTTNTVYTYGGPGDLWGYVGMTPATINNTNFGTLVQFSSTGGNDMNVDNINIKIYYTA